MLASQLFPRFSFGSSTTTTPIIIPRAHSTALTRRITRPLSHRTLTTTLPRSQPTANPVSRPDLLRRNPARDLPTLSSLSSTRKWLTTLPIFVLIITISALGIFNYQKVNSPIITATLYSLRTNPEVRAVLGDEVYFASKWAWIWGEMNLVQGKVDVTFRVKGTRGKGVCRFRARRAGGRSALMKTLEWSLTLDEDGRTIELLAPDERDPLEGAAV